MPGRDNPKESTNRWYIGRDIDGYPMEPILQFYEPTWDRWEEIPTVYEEFSRR